MAPFLRRFFGPGMPEPSPGPQRGTGSGVVMDARGDIVTNRHVVSGATYVKVTFSDGREFTAKTLGMDSETDVAVIRLDRRRAIWWRRGSATPTSWRSANGCWRSAARSASIRRSPPAS